MEHEEQATFQETERLKELARNRYKIEAENSGSKNRIATYSLICRFISEWNSSK